MQQEISFSAEPVGNAYVQLIRHALGRCSTLLMVEREGIGLSEAAQDFLSRLQPFETRRQRGSRWPGTQLLDDEAVILEYRFCAEVMELVQQAAVGLFEWEQPALPEDPCLLRPSGEPWLVTIAHERDAYLRLTADELEELVSKVPELRECLRLPPCPPSSFTSD
jgi:hypothetical protein